MEAGYFLKAKIYVVSHKNLSLPNDDLYYPIQVGDKRHRNSGYLQDDIGENMAAKNAYYCELTAQYWIWKNQSADIQGIVHYRRFFANYMGKNKVMTDKPFDFILQAGLLQETLAKYDMILPPKETFFEANLWLHYRFQHHIVCFKAVQNVIEEAYPDYIAAFEKVMFHQRSAHMYNMFIAQRHVFTEYSEWLFDVLKKVENIIDISSYSAYEQRVYGFLSEFLLNIWVTKNNINTIEIPLVLTEHRNYLTEGIEFFRRRMNDISRVDKYNSRKS